MRLLAEGPAGSGGAVLGELAGLTKTEQRVARAAAAVGDPFLIDLLLEACPEPSSEIVAALDALVLADVLRTVEAPSRLAFRHPVVRDVLYRRTSVSERATMHRRIGTMLAARGATAAERAPHIVGGGLAGLEDLDTLVAAAREIVDRDPATALRWATAAQSEVRDNGLRCTEATLLAARARLLVGDITGTREAWHTAPCATPGQRRPAVVGVYIGRAERMLGRYAEAEALLRDGLAAVATEPSPDAATLLTELANLTSDGMDFTAASGYAGQAVDIARRLGDQVREASALAEDALARAGAGDLALADTAVVSAAKLIDGLSDAALLQDLSCLHRLGLAEILVERFIDAHRHLVRGVSLCRRTGQRYALVGLLKSLGEARLRLGRLVEAEQTLDEAAFHAGRDDIVPFQCTIAGFLALTTYWTGGSVDEAVATAERAAARCNGLPWGWAARTGSLAGELLVLAGESRRGHRMLLAAGGGPLLPRIPALWRVRVWEPLTAGALAAGDETSARHYVELARSHVSATYSASRSGFAERSWILAHGRTATPDTLSEVVNAAVAGFAGSQELLEVGRTALAAGLATLEAGGPDTGQLAAAREHLEVTSDVAVTCGAVRLEQLVAQAKRRLAHRMSRRWAAVLTPREIEIATLAAGGMTSAEIGRKLFVSARTVESHLGRVYRKLDVSSRAALAQLMADGESGAERPTSAEWRLADELAS